MNLSPNNISNCDIAIIGGGLAGLTLAHHLLKYIHVEGGEASPSIMILERNRFPYPEAAHKVGESTVEIGASYFADVLGLRPHLLESQLRKLGIRIFFTENSASALNERIEFGSNRYFPAGTFQIDRGRFENYLCEELRAKGVRIIDGARVRDVALDSHTEHTIHFQTEVSEDQLHKLSARWVIDASGGAAILKKKLKLAVDSEHVPNAAWFRIAKKINIDEWGSGEEWERHNQGEFSRWFSTNHLMGRGYWVWIIPLASQSTSIGIVADPRIHPLDTFNTFERSLNWLQTYEPRCAQHVRENVHLLQDFIARKHYSHGCSRVFSADRWAITGDAGVFIDPLYSPGSDFIAIANTYIVELISRDLRGKPIAGSAQIFNDLFLSFSENTLNVFRDQYPLLGNARVMSVKVFWDYAVYWSFLAFVFFKNKLTDVSSLSLVKNELAKVSQLNRDMQLFLRTWDQADREKAQRAFLDLSSVPYIFALNKALRDPLDEAEFPRRLEQNVRQLEEFAEEIASYAISRVPEIALTAGSLRCSRSYTSRLTAIFYAIDRGRTPQSEFVAEALTSPLSASTDPLM